MTPRAALTKHLLDGDDSIFTGKFDKPDEKPPAQPGRAEPTPPAPTPRPPSRRDAVRSDAPDPDN